MNRYLHYRSATPSTVQAAATGGTTPGACVTFPCPNSGSCLISLQNGAGGAWTGTEVFEYSPDYLQDGSNDATALWLALKATPSGGGVAVSSVTANGQWFANIGGVNAVRVRQSVNAAPTISPAVTITVSEATNPDAVGASGGTTVAIDQTTPGTTNLVATNADATVAAGTAPAKALLGAVQYKATQPTLTDGQCAAAQGDSSGNTIVDLMRLDPSNDGIGAAKVGTQSVAVTTSGAGYVLGDVVGGIITLATVNYATGRRLKLASVQINDKDGNSIGLNIYFFKAAPAAGTYTDNGALAWGTGDSANKVGQIKVGAGDWLKDSSQSSVNVGNLGEKMSVAATSSFMLIIAQAGATFTNGGLTMELNFDQE